MVKTSINAENPTVNTVRALVTRSVTIGGVGEHLDPEQVTRLRGRPVPRGRSGRQAGLPGRARRHPDLPAAAAAAGRPRCAGRPGRGGHGGDRARHPPGHDRGASGPPSRLPGRAGSEDVYPGWEILNHESWLPETFTSLGTIGADRLAELTGGLMTDTSVDGADQPARRRGRRGDRGRAGVPARGGRLLRRQQVLLPRRLRTGADRPVPLGRRPDHQRRDDRHPRRHPGPGADQRGRHADPGRTARRCAWSSRRAPTPCTPPRSAPPRTPGPPAPRSPPQTHVSYRDRAGPAGAVDHADEVRGHLDRGQGLLQARADRRRRRRGDHLRPAHHPDLGDAPRTSARSATTTATTSSASGTGSRTSPGATSPTPPTCAARAPGTPSTASGTGSPSPWPPASPRTSSGPSTSTTSTRPPSTSPRTRPTPTPSSSRTPARCCTGWDHRAGNGAGEPDGRGIDLAGMEG